MKRFHNILFVSQGLTDETSALKQALSLARNNRAELKVFLVCPDLPKEMADYREKYEAFLVEQIKTSLQAAREALTSGDADVSANVECDNANPFVLRCGEQTIQIEVELGGTPAVRIIRQVLKNGHDLVMKEAEPKEGEKGFKAVDMELLRKCPCSVFLSRPIGRHRDDIKVAAAVDPESPTSEGYDLSLRLLEVARAYADTCDGELNVVSCWDYEFEESLRHNPWITMKKEDVDDIVREYCHQSRTALDRVIEQASISGKMRVHHVRGRAEYMIPKLIEENGIDVLIMGTVARTGIPGFIIGNTAENIVQKLGCSLLAMKPNGFMSPVNV